MTTSTSHHSHHLRPDNDQDQGSFLTGLTIGLFAGAAGYFLFATEKGKKLKDQLIEEWQASNLDQLESSFDQIKRATIKETFMAVIQNVLESHQEVKPLKALSKGKKAPEAAKKSDPKFKGV